MSQKLQWVPLEANPDVSYPSLDIENLHNFIRLYCILGYELGL
jgi:hypothetical protein